MRSISDKLAFLVGSAEILENIDKLPPFRIFDSTVIEFLSAFSKTLSADQRTKRYPDVATFAFWCRKASVESLKKPYADVANRLGRGVVFHIAPSNVAVNFAYSLVAGLLAGNANIVRLPSKDFEQVDIICETINRSLTEAVRPYICLVRYERSKEINAYLSRKCDTRVIWGGDNTIAEIRKAPLKPRANEICFADRYSMCVINADKYLEADNKHIIAQNFYNDTYLSDQNACTSPRVVVWMGKNVAKAQAEFWDNLYPVVKEKYALQPARAVAKLAALYKLAAANEGARRQESVDNLILRVRVESLNENLMDYLDSCGYFLEYKAENLEEILPLCGDKLQTLSYYGVDPAEIERFVDTFRPKGVDRVVPIGKTMDFSLIWDGYDLIRSMSREVTVSKR